MKLSMDRRALSIYDPAEHQWRVKPGANGIPAGNASRSAADRDGYNSRVINIAEGCAHGSSGEVGDEEPHGETVQPD